MEVEHKGGIELLEFRPVPFPKMERAECAPAPGDRLRHADASEAVRLAIGPVAAARAECAPAPGDRLRHADASEAVRLAIGPVAATFTQLQQADRRPDGGGQRPPSRPSR